MHPIDPNQERCGIAMRDCRMVTDRLAVGVPAATDVTGVVARLFVLDTRGERHGPFRGYVVKHHTPKRGDCFLMRVHGGRNTLFKTERGAVAAMIRRAPSVAVSVDRA